MRPLALRGLLLCCVLFCPLQLQGATWSDHFQSLAALSENGVRVSALVERLDNGRALAAVDAHQRLIPASVSKLFVARAALQRFGADHRFRTHLRSDAALAEGVLKGDLIFEGAGDPGLLREDLRGMTAQLQARGIEKIQGDIVIDNALFGTVDCQTKDRCEAHEESAHAFDAPLSAAGIDYGTVELVIYPAASSGAPARTVIKPLGIAGFVLHGTIDTVSADSGTRIRVVRKTDDSGTHHLHVDGRIAAGSAPVYRSRSIAHPARHTGNALRALLDSSGVVVNGEVRVAPGSANRRAARSLASTASEPLSKLLHTVMQYSNNYMADMLTLHLGRSPAARPPLKEAANALLSPLRALSSEATASTPPRLRSGSGLSVDSRVSARDLVALLRDSYQQTALFPAFLGSLPVPRFSRNSQLAFHDADWADRLAAKTGWLSEPVGVRSIAGYLRLQDGAWAAFAIILNGTESAPALPRHRTLGAIRADLQRLMKAH